MVQRFQYMSGASLNLADCAKKTSSDKKGNKTDVLFSVVLKEYVS